jgi:glycerate kinase
VSRTGGTRRVLVAPDKFRGTATALQAARWLSEGLRRHLPPGLVTAMPVADGGEGTIDCFEAAGFGARSVTVSGPLGQPARARIASRDRTAVIETAQACGVSLLTPAPATAMKASSLGVGQLISHALDAGCTAILIGVGGTACTDGGAGLLQALGARLADAHGHELPRGGGSLTHLDTIDLRPLDPRLRSCRLTVAADVSSPLLGPSGAAHAFGPQKGAGPLEVAALERGLQALSRAVAAVPGQGHVTETATGSGGGAGGGIAWALQTVLGARRASGAETILNLIGFDRAAGDAELVLTGEGVLDMSSLAGKAPSVVARRAKGRGLPVIAVTGQCTVPESRWREAGIDAVCELAALAGSPQRSLAATPELLREAGRRIALRAMTATRPVAGDTCEAT